MTAKRAGMRQGGAHEPSQQRVGGAGWDATPPGQEIPCDGGDQPGKNHLEVDKVLVDRSGDGIPDFELANDIARDKEGSEVENGRPQHGLERRQYLGRNNRGDGIGGVVKTIDIIEYQRQDDNDHEETHNALCIFNYDGLDHVSGIFAFVGNDFHHLVDLAFLYDFLRIGFGLEQPLDRKIENVIGLVLDAVDLHQRI